MTTDAVREALRQKLRDRWSEYSAEVLERPAAEVFERADEIAAARFCYDQLTEKLTSYPVEYLEYLLRFEDPVTVVQDQWASEQNADIGDKLIHTLYTLWSTGNAEQDHPLDPEWRPEREGPSMC